MMIRFLTALALIALPLVAGAQTKAETSLYAKTVKKPTVKNAEKFLKKYPSSVYAPKVIRLRDSLFFFALDPEDAAGVLYFRKEHPESYFLPLAEERIRVHNTSTISPAQAAATAGECAAAVGWKEDNVEHTIARPGRSMVRATMPHFLISGDIRWCAHTPNPLANIL